MGISYKLKIVIIMVIVGITFLVYDTISDRSIRRKKMIKKIERQGPSKADRDPRDKLRAEAKK